MQHQAMAGPAGAQRSVHTHAAEVLGVLWRVAQVQCHALTGRHRQDSNCTIGVRKPHTTKWWMGSTWATVMVGW